MATSRGRLKGRMDPKAFTPEGIRKRVEEDKRIKEAYQCLKKSNVPDQSNVSEKLAWAFLQARPSVIYKAIQILNDVGHFGQKLIVALLADMDISESERTQIAVITQHLMTVREQICFMARADKPIAIVTLKTACTGCQMELLAYNSKITDVTLYQPLKKSTVKLIRMYCKNCNRSHGPFCVDKGKRSSVKRMEKGAPIYTERVYYNWNEVKYVEGNERNYFSKQFCEQLATLLLHCWVSAQGYAEAFTEAMHNFEVFGDLAQSTIPEIELERRLWGKAYMEYEIWRNIIDDNRLSGQKDLKRSLNTEKYLNDLELDTRAIYKHKHTNKCNELGCEWMAICDGNWKNKYTLCMFQELNEGPIPNVSVPSNCRNQPENRSKAFCLKHGLVMQRKGYPTGLREFLSHCKSKRSQAEAFLSNQQSQTAEEIPNDDEMFDISVSDDEDSKSDNSKPTGPHTRSMRRQEMTNVQTILEEAGDIKDDGSKEEKLLKMIDLKRNDGAMKCSKDTGGKKVICCWSRGHFFIVSPCGQILRWAPLYGSESPSQAYLIMLEHLSAVFKSIPESDWHKYTIVYDNMCNVDKMRAARVPLPTTAKDGSELFPAPFDQCWLKCNKAIDKLHLSNHKDPNCRIQYNSEKINQMHPDCSINTMRAEETFVWLSRYKKILCAMPKTNHLFFLYRLILRRNSYTKWKLEAGKNVLLPKARSAMTT